MKTILIVLDGLNYSVAEHAMGYLLGSCKAGLGHLRRINCELPSLSRPLYECILTGKTPVESGIIHNHVNRLSTQKSIFHHVKTHNKISAAAAYHWISELYNRTPFNIYQDRHVHDLNLMIPYGSFYFEDHYPDSHTLADAEHLRRHHNPDFLFIHTMNVDDACHKFGGDTSQYRNAARRVDEHLAYYLPKWLEEGYQVFITADHGANADRSHGGNLPEEIDVPLFIFGTEHSTLQNQTIHQVDICATICQLIDKK